MSKPKPPWEEEWEPDPLSSLGNRISVRSKTGRRTRGMVGFPSQRREHAYLEHQEARSRLAAAAPDMARILLKLVDEESSSRATEAREVLEKAGVLRG